MRDFQLNGRSTVFAANGMCATSTPLAAKVALQLLESGGNAVDAAIGAAVLLGFCEPQSTGIGGDCFVLIQPPNEKKVVALNGSGRSPIGLDSEELRNEGFKEMPLYGVESITVPGAVDAFCRLSNDYGKRGLEFSLIPAIHYAENGIAISPRTAFDWANSASILKGDAREHFLINGNALSLGQIFRAPGQAKALRLIAKNGRAGFYEGEVAADMVSSLNNLGGSHTLEDFFKTNCNYCETINGFYDGYELIEHPPNGQGATALLMANILNNFDLKLLDPFGVERTHIETEAAKLAYDARNRFIADLDYTNRLQHMLSADIADKLAGLIDLSRATHFDAKMLGSVHKDTVYLTVVDKDQMAVSMIYSIFHSFGSGMASRKFGINFQNRGAGFTLERGHPNEVSGFKRPMHTIIPAMLRNANEFTMPFGVMGGAYQPNGHVRFMTNLIDYNMDIQEALDGPRSFYDDGDLMLERGYNDQVRDALKNIGHKVNVPDSPIGGGQAIKINWQQGVLEGASDPRKDGCAIGY